MLDTTVITHTGSVVSKDSGLLHDQTIVLVLLGLCTNYHIYPFLTHSNCREA